MIIMLAEFAWMVHVNELTGRFGFVAEHRDNEY